MRRRGHLPGAEPMRETFPRSGQRRSWQGRPPTVTSPALGRIKAGDHPYRGRLPRSVGTEEAGDGTGMNLEAQLIDGTLPAVVLGEAAGSDPGRLLSSTSSPLSWS